LKPTLVNIENLAETQDYYNGYTIDDDFPLLEELLSQHERASALAKLSLGETVEGRVDST
jgi:hypothetical protein